jgi:hypothetical protein
LITLSGQSAVTRLEVIMVIPGLSIAMVQLHKPNTAFQQSTGDDHLPSMHAGTVQIVNVLGFFADVKGVRGFGLHAECQFKRLDSGFQCRVTLAILGVFSIQLRQQVQLLALFGQ